MLKKIKDLTKEEKPCYLCSNRKTMNCPNSKLCYSTKDKPLFKSLDSEVKYE